MIIINGVETTTGNKIVSPDIDGGTIDGAIIGDTTPAAGTFTTVTTDTISEKTAAAGVTIDGITLKDGGALDITGGTNTFNLTNGTAILDVAAGSTVNVDASLTVTGASTINQNVSTTGSPTFAAPIASTAIADNTSTTQLATTAFAKSEDAEIANPKSFSQGVNMTYAASGSTGITVAHDAKYANTTNSCGYTIKRALPDWTPSANQLLYQKLTGGAGVQIEIVATTGVIKLTLNATAYDSSAPGFVDGTEHQIDIDISVGAANTTVSFYADGVLLSSPAAQANVDLTNTALLYVNGTSAIRYAGVVKDTLAWNRSRTAAEILSLYRNGISFADKWGSQTSLITGNDSTFAGASNWTNGSFATYDETTGGVLTLEAATVNERCFLPAINAPTVKGKKYRLSFDITNASGGVWLIWDAVPSGQITATAQTSGTYSAEFTATSELGGLTLFGNTIGATGVFDNFLLYEIGATLALESEGIKTPKWFDSSTNALDASYPAAGSSLTLPYQPGTESLLSITTVSLAADADTTIYTVPTGRRLVLTKAILIVGADAGTTVISIGADGAETNWLPNNTLSALDAANDVGVLMPVPNATTVLGKSYAAATVIQAKVSSQAGGATNALHLYGYLY